MTRVDVNRLGDFVFDNPPGPGQSQRATPAQIRISTRVQSWLDDASGMVDAALIVGNRYTADDLVALQQQTITDPDPAQTQVIAQARSLLLRIVCDLAYGLAAQTRGHDPASAEGIAPSWTRGNQYLDQLRAGAWIFGAFKKAANAGLTHLEIPHMFDKHRLLSGQVDRMLGPIQPFWPRG